MDGVPRKFVHGEQWMMSAKALLFDDLNTLNLILDKSDPKVIKDLGKIVKPFNKITWDAHARNLVYIGLCQKFQQNGRHWEVLFSTKGVLVEASPYDRIWGIGLGAEHPDAYNPQKWLGTNWLGNVLMAVRSDLTACTDLSKKYTAIFKAAKSNTHLPELYMADPKSF